ILSGAMNVLILQCYVCFFFFVSVYTRTCRNNASILNCGVFKSAGKNQKKLRKNGNFYVKLVFDQIDFLYGCNLKNNHCKYLKFSPNVYVSVIYIQLNFQKFLTFFDSKFYEICLKRDNLQE
ncbi:hypothetical protein FWK35_00014254, partial [Aphis craccivora]